MQWTPSRVLGLVIIAVPFVVMVGFVGYRLWWDATHYVVERTEYSPSPGTDELQLTDDVLADKTPQFDETLIDSRLLDDWEVNKSAAVIKLDCPDVKPDTEGFLLELRPTYADAVSLAEKNRLNLLPSANLVDGAAKQFDDGLYAALDLASFEGRLAPLPAAPDVIASIFGGLPGDSSARPFLAAALELAGKPVQVDEQQKAEKQRLLDEFDDNKARSKPISFYNWTPELQQVWRFFRFLQYEFDETNLDVPRSVAAALKEDPGLLERYQAVNHFYGRLTNPMICLPADALIDSEATNLTELATERHARRAKVAILPPSTSRETELFDRLFPLGLPPEANLMSELIRRIRSGDVDLAPGEGDGWYQYQVYALETLLLPSRGHETEKLLLTAKYKKRLVEAFKALVTKRRETHARQLDAGGETSEPPNVKPRLRIEPCATCYLRTARAYDFLQNFLTAAVGETQLAELRGLRRGGERDCALPVELRQIRDRFYGFYLIACEDIGQRPHFLEDESVDREAVLKTATDWLENIGNDADLRCDTRVSVPIFVSVLRGKTRLWATLGVRLAKLDASYARPPKIRPSDGSGEWEEAGTYELGESSYVIPVDEFAEIEIDGLDALTRDELRDICDRNKSKDDILQAIRQRAQ